MDLAIMGAGYVGLVTAACLAHLGHNVICIDIDAARIERLRLGDVPVHEPGLDKLVRKGLHEGRLRFSHELSAARGRDLVIVCVGTLDAHEEWSGSIVEAAVQDLAADHAAPRGIVIRSTLLPGTAVAIAAETRRIDASVRIAHNPEFTREASAISDFLEPDRVVIGVDGADDDGPGAALAAALREVYEPLDAPVVVTDLTSAETIKLASNVFLAAKISFANELSRLAAATGADVDAVVDGMGLDKRIMRSFLTPGPGFGGSCFPSQARALPELARRHGVRTPIIDSVWASNMAQADWLLDGLERAASRPIEGMRVALLGLTFKAGTDDLRESPALRLGEMLLARGASLAAYDPAVTDEGVASLAAFAVTAGREVSAASSAEAACVAVDAVVVATEWPQFSQLDWSAIGPSMAGRVIVDGRRVVDAEAAARAGLRVVSLGAQANGTLQPAG